MRKMKFVGVRFILFGIVGAGVLGLVITGLWNALLPAILGLPTITFWQALGLFLLSRLLFGRIGSGGHRMHKARFVEGWNSLTIEERQRFKEAVKRCHPNFGGGESAEKV